VRGEVMDIIYSDELPKGLTFECNGILVIGTKIGETERVVEKFAG
jgi:hypothetical protein